jgi:hypothetical protein
MEICFRCGFLANRNFQTGNADETINDTRITGLTIHGHTAQFFCYANSPSFLFPQRDSGMLIWPPMHCSSIVPYKEGKPPKEHEEMTLLEKVREENRVAFMAQKEMYERHHAEMAELARDKILLLENHREEDLRDAKDFKTESRAESLFNRRLAITGIVVSIASILATVYATVKAAYIQVDTTK